MIRSIGFGSGSGGSTLLLSKIRDNYPYIIVATFSVFLLPKLSDIHIFGPHNSTLSVDQLLENSYKIFVINNEALMLNQKEPKYADLNWLICMVMSRITAGVGLRTKTG